MAVAAFATQKHEGDMIEIVWEFEVAAGHQREFESHYGPEGTWVELFRRDAAFQGTTLLRDREKPTRYITVDRWNDLPSYEAFRLQFAKEYQAIDADMENLTLGEKRLGVFDSVHRAATFHVRSESTSHGR
ncbi:MAG: antibiotic biosynthesis monooxygenase family protein [Terriglobales bacterium]